MRLSEIAAKITEKEKPPVKAAPPPPKLVDKKPALVVTKKEKKSVLKAVGEKVKVEKSAEATPPPPPPLPPPPKPIDITGKSTWDLLLELGEVPHYMVARNPVWAEGPDKAIVEDINTMQPTYLLKMREYYDTLEKMGELTDKERFAAQVMRDRIWNENIGDVSVDLVPLTPEDRQELEKVEISLISGERMPVFAASNRELAQHIYLKVGGPKEYKGYKGSQFDRGLSAERQNEFSKEMTPEFDQDGLLGRVSTTLSKDALLKRILFEHTKVPISVMKERQGRAAEWKAAADAYYPPEYEQVKGYYRPEWKDADSLTVVQQEMIKVPPADLLKTYQIYFIMKSKGQLSNKEEELLDEMERILYEFQEKGIITVARPKTVPPLPVTQERFTDYLKAVNDLFGTLSEEAVVKLSKRSESDVVLKVLRSGTASEDERKVFVKAIDELFEELPEAEMDKFSESPNSNLYMRIVDKYGEG